MANKKKYDWNKLRDEFVRSNISLRDLSRRYSVSYSYLGQVSSKEKWFEQRDTIQTQAREAVAEEMVRQADDQNSKLAKLVCKDGEAHMKRSLQTGDKLYTLFQAAVTAMSQGNLREMRQAIDAWVVLDNQMRKIHNIDDNTDKPLVNIHVLAALPSREERAAKAVEV
tara:strand:+ start:734 stop:1237 length:504 start_codon:yes stop_codon:yes gene_type:complete